MKITEFAQNLPEEILGLLTVDETRELFLPSLLFLLGGQIFSQHTDSALLANINAQITNLLVSTENNLLSLQNENILFIVDAINKSLFPSDNPNPFYDACYLTNTISLYTGFLQLGIDEPEIEASIIQYMREPEIFVPLVLDRTSPIAKITELLIKFQGAWMPVEEIERRAKVTHHQLLSIREINVGPESLKGPYPIKIQQHVLPGLNKVSHMRVVPTWFTDDDSMP